MRASLGKPRNSATPLSDRSRWYRGPPCLTLALMSYDIVVRRTAHSSADARAIADDIAALTEAGSVEIHVRTDADDLVLVCVPASIADATLSAFYVALVGFARAKGLALFNPQGGGAIPLDTAGAYPPGCEPTIALTHADVQEMAWARQYPEIGRQLHRIPDLNRRNAQGHTVLDLVLFSRIERKTMKTGDRDWKALQKLAISMIERGADPLKLDADNHHSLFHAAKFDHSEVVAHILGKLSAGDRARVLRDTWDRKSLLRHAQDRAILFSDRTAKLLQKLGAK